LWGAVRATVRGPTLAHIAWVILSAALCVVTKTTAAIAVPLAPVALLLAWMRSSPRRQALFRAAAGLWIGGLVLLVLVFSWGDAALWFRFTSQQGPTSQRVTGAPDGKRALALSFSNADLARDMAAEDDAPSARDTPALQILPDQDVAALRGVTVTLSAWMWATQPAQVRTPALNDGAQYVVRTVDVDRTPAWHTVTTTVDAEAAFIYVIVRPMPGATANGAGLTVYYDGITLADQDQPEINWVRNGSAERTWPYARPAVDRVFVRYTRRSLSQFCTSILDLRRTSRIYGFTALTLFQSFWARFGWGEITLAKGWYWALGVWTLLSAAGALRAAARMHRLSVRTRRAVWLLLAAAVLVWANTMLRIHPLATRAFIPVARYAYPAIVPTMMALVAGWTNLVPRRYRRWSLGLAGIVFLTVDAASAWTLWAHHYWR
jgi:hypothetical protein